MPSDSKFHYSAPLFHIASILEANLSPISSFTIESIISSGKLDYLHANVRSFSKFLYQETSLQNVTSPNFLLCTSKVP